MSTLFLTESINRLTGPLPSVIVPKRPTLESPEFGDWLRLRRGARSHAEIANQIRKRVQDAGLGVHPSLIVKLEQGRVPSWPLLTAISEVFKEPLDTLLVRLAQSMRFPGGNPLVPDGLTLTATRPGESTAEEVGARWANDPDIEQRLALVPLLDDPIAAGPALHIEDAAVSSFVPFEAANLARVGSPLCVRVGDHERSMQPTIQPGETVLLDCSDAIRLKPKNDRIYAVNVPGAGATLKRVFRLERGLLLVADNRDKQEYPTLRLEQSNGLWVVRLDGVDDPDTDEPVAPHLEDAWLWRNLIVGEVMWKAQRL